MTQAQLKNAFSYIGEVDAALAPSTLHLKIAVNDYSLRYFILSQTHRQVMFFGNYALHNLTNETELCERVERMVERDEILQLKFGQVTIGIDTPYSLVPAAFSAILPLAAAEVSQTFAAVGLELRYTMPAVAGTLKRFYPEASLSHVAATYINIFPEWLDDTTNKLWVNVAEGYFDVVRFNEQRSVHFVNRFTFKTATDFIYHLLLCAEQQHCDREVTELVLCGEVDIQSRIYDMCYRYFRNISFAQKPEHIHFSKAFDMFPKHLHFQLYNLQA